MATKSDNTEPSFVQDGEQVKSTIKRSNIFNEFFWICSGANRHILRQCPTEYSKYFGIGGTIFFTAAMATLSGGYAFYTIFNSTLWAVLFGVFWGLLIFNLDRFIVNTMYSDGKYTISWGELAAGTPRLVIAIFLGIVISTPLEMKIFEDEINVEIDNLREIKLAEHTRKDSTTLAVLQSSKEVYNQKIDSIQGTSLSKMYASNIEVNNEAQLRIDQSIRTQENARTKAQGKSQSLWNQRANTTDSIQRVSLDNQIRRVQKEISIIDKTIQSLTQQSNKNRDDYSKIVSRATSQKESQIEEYKQEVEALDEDIKVVKQRLNNAKIEYKEKLDKEFNGFQAHMLAFDKIKNENSTTRVVSIFIMLMFIIIEVAPTFFKMMIASGPYDELLNEEMHRKKVRAIQNVSNMNDEVNTQLQISTEKNRNKLEAEVAANKQLLEKIANVQVEILETAVEEWRKAELEKIKANPSQYIKSNIKKHEQFS